MRLKDSEFTTITSSVTSLFSMPIQLHAIKTKHKNTVFCIDPMGLLSKIISSKCFYSPKKNSILPLYRSEQVLSDLLDQYIFKAVSLEKGFIDT